MGGGLGRGGRGGESGAREAPKERGGRGFTRRVHVLVLWPTANGHCASEREEEYGDLTQLPTPLPPVHRALLHARDAQRPRRRAWRASARELSAKSVPFLWRCSASTPRACCASSSTRACTCPSAGRQRRRRGKAEGRSGGWWEKRAAAKLEGFAMGRGCGATMASPHDCRLGGRGRGGE